MEERDPVLRLGKAESYLVFPKVAKHLLREL